MMAPLTLPLPSRQSPRYSRPAALSEAIEVDTLGSERDEPGCLRFNVLQDEHDESAYYFFEVYKDQAALEAHRRTIFPAARAYWGKP